MKKPGQKRPSQRNKPAHRPLGVETLARQADIILARRRVFGLRALKW